MREIAAAARKSLPRWTFSVLEGSGKNLCERSVDQVQSKEVSLLGLRHCYQVGWVTKRGRQGRRNVNSASRVCGMLAEGFSKFVMLQ